MGLSSYLVLSSFAIGFAHCFPNPESTSTIGPSPRFPYPSGTPYPAEPTTNEFQYSGFDALDKDANDPGTKIHRAFEDWSSVIGKAIDSLADPDDSTFKTWFPETRDGEDARNVLTEVYSELLDTSSDTSVPQERVGTMVCDNEDFGAKDDVTLCNENTTSYYFLTESRFHVCDHQLGEKLAKATDVKCSDLGDRVSSKMVSVTAFLVHEFMHASSVGDTLPNSIADALYGASDCMRLAKSDQADRAFRNADSYHWFALHAFYNSQCEKSFEAPEIPDHMDVANDEKLYMSPRYDERLASGALAGV